MKAIFLRKQESSMESSFKEYMKIVFCMILVMLMLPLRAQQINSKSVHDKVANHYKSLQTPKKLKSNRGYYMNFTQLVESREDQQYTVAKMNVKYIITGSFRMVKTNDVDLYQDTTETYMVAKKQKTIFVGSTPKNNMDKQVKEVLNMIPYDMIATASVESFTSSKSDSNLYIIKLKASKDYEKAAHINKLTFWVNVKSDKIDKIRADFTEDYNLKNMTIEYHEINSSYKCSVTKARSYIFSNNKILSQYKGYKLVDQR